jgi:hypothetical protein
VLHVATLELGVDKRQSVAVALVGIRVASSLCGFNDDHIGIMIRHGGAHCRRCSSKTGTFAASRATATLSSTQHFIEQGSYRSTRPAGLPSAVRTGTAGPQPGALAGLPITGDIVLPTAYATLVRREHRKCAPLCPTYLGYREWPAGASESDKRLLIAHANARQWKPMA